jgi:hypothetical protein
MRWLPFVAWFICVAGVILSLVTLLAGVGGDGLESPAIIPVNQVPFNPIDFYWLSSAFIAY